MRLNIASGLLAIGAAVAAPGLAVHAQEAVPANPYAQYLATAAQPWSVLEEYCWGCHNFNDFTANLALDVLDAETVPENAEIWERVIRKLRARTMPPPGEERPVDAQYEAVASWLEGYLDLAASLNPNPGWVGLHRLNREEYVNAIRDILGVDWIPQADLLPDDADYDGFTNIASSLLVTSGFLDRYLTAAYLVATDAVGVANPTPGSTTFFLQPDAEGHQAHHVPGAPLGTRGGVVGYWYLPGDGEYVVDIADMFQGDIYFNAREHLATVSVAINGRLVHQVDIGGPNDALLHDYNQATFTQVQLNGPEGRLKNIRFQAEGGPAVIWVGFQLRSLAESEAELHHWDPRGGMGRIFNINGFQISGPFNGVATASTPSRAKIFSCYPQTQAEQAPCAQQILSSIASQAYRRSATPTEMDEVLEYYAQGLETGGFEEGIRTGLTRILSSANFLYRFTTPEESRKVAEGIYALSDYELASRLSFFLWRSVPDAELLQAAANGQLRDPAVLEAQVRRMLADDRSFTLASQFAFQWLHLDRIQTLVPFDNLIFPYFSFHRTVVTEADGGDPDPHLDMIMETLLFVDGVFRGNESVVDLLDANYTYLNERVAVHYGINDVKGSRFRRVELDDSVRWGLLGKAAVLMTTSYPNRTAPVLRGEWILANILGSPPSPPPPTVEALLPENQVGAEFLTVAQRLKEHANDPTCFACHGLMDPLGFALENFNAVGRWRLEEELTGIAVSTNAGVTPDGVTVDGPDALRNYLLGRSDRFVETLAEKLLMYAVGRPLEARYDMPYVRAIADQAAKDDYRFVSLVMAIVTSAPFQQMRVPDAQDLVVAGLQ